MQKMTCIQTGLLGVNTYIVPVDSENNVFVVDPGGHPELIVNAIESIKGSLIGIVLTHGHFDHVGALPALKEKYPSAFVCIHQGDISYIGKHGYETHRKRFAELRFSADEFFTHDQLPEVDVALEEGKQLPFSNDWVVLHTPGHTEGSVCLYNEGNNMLLSGDTLFAGTYGRTDLPGGSLEKMQNSLQRLFTLPEDVIVYPGHEMSTSIKNEKNMVF